MVEDEQGQVTRLLANLGDSADALDRLANLVYEDIHRLARQQRNGIRRAETLRTTVLVHEAFLKVFRSDGASISNSAHLMRIMVLAMRQIIVDHARKRLADKRGGDAVHVAFDEQYPADGRQDAERVLDVERALEKLAELDNQLADMVAARFYAGFSTDDIAQMHGVSRRSVQRCLQRANVWLRYELGGLQGQGD